MRTGEYVFGVDASLFLPGVLAGVAIALLCAALSVFVVVKRMAFIGQGVSHAAFGGVGLSAVLGLTAGATFGVTAAFCVASALGIAAMSRRKDERADTVIGVYLVGAMALGAILLALHARRGARGGTGAVSWESLLFGSIVTVGPADAWLAWVVALVTLGVLALHRRRLLFWAFDEAGAEAAGVSVGWVRAMTLALLAVAIVTAMKLAGVVLATALLVLPGATALRLTSRLRATFAVSLGAALLGMLGGLVLAFEADLPPGPSIVAALVGMYALAHAVPARRGDPSGAGTLAAEQSTTGASREDTP